MTEAKLCPRRFPSPMGEASELSFFVAEKLQLSAIAKLSTDYLGPRSFTEATVPITQALRPPSRQLQSEGVDSKSRALEVV